jgi:ubiquinone/menaquinone biosynthesis C-methylase UbiE
MKLHLGCGWRNFGKDWIHIDGGEYSHLDYNDITKLPFDDNSVDLIYSSHVIEYFDREEIIPILLEWKRVLKVNGTLRIAVPNFKKMVEIYLKEIIPLDNILGPLYGKMTMGDSTIYHKTTYDEKSLKLLLNNIGFININVYDWRSTDHSEFDDHSQAYIPHMDKENGTLISLNIECQKF